MILDISHHTTYRYAEAVSFSPHYIRLRPREDIFARLHRFEMTLRPDVVIHWIRDPFDCHQARVFFPHLTHELTIRISMIVENIARNPFDFLLENHAATFPFSYTEEETAALQPWLRPRVPDPENQLKHWLAERIPPKGESSIGFIFELNKTVRDSFDYQSRDRHGVQSPRETLDRGIGTCRDFSWLLAESCRTLGLAARLAGGYLHVPKNETSESPPLQDSLHAWTEVYLPGGGWIAVDPTNGIFCDEHYITTATGPAPENISAVHGNYYHPVAVKSRMHSELSIVERPEIP